MSHRWLPIVAATIIAMQFPVSALANDGPNTALKTAAQGAGVYLDDCPLDFPIGNTECTAVTVQLYRHRVPEVGYERWATDALIEDVLVHADGSYAILGTVYGLTYDANVTYDAQHLSTASLSSVIPMSDGSSLPVDLRWTADGKAWVTGADGPFTEGRHFRDACTTANFNENQKIRPQIVVGIIGDRTIADYVEEGYAFLEASSFNNWFHWIVADHGNCP